MANYNDLKTGIDAVIKTNGRQEISGAALNTQLKNMIAELGAGYQYMGVATPATNPGTPDANVFYLASEAGPYTNFGGIVINEGEVCALVWNGTWAKQVTGAATADKLNQLGQNLAVIWIKNPFTRDISFLKLNECVTGIRCNSRIPSNLKLNVFNGRAAYNDIQILIADANGNAVSNLYKDDIDFTSATPVKLTSQNTDTYIFDIYIIPNKIYTESSFVDISSYSILLNDVYINGLNSIEEKTNIELSALDAKFDLCEQNNGEYNWIKSPCYNNISLLKLDKTIVSITPKTFIPDGIKLVCFSGRIAQHDINIEFKNENNTTVSSFYTDKISLSEDKPVRIETSGTYSFVIYFIPNQIDTGGFRDLSSYSLLLNTGYLNNLVTQKNNFICGEDIVCFGDSITMFEGTADSKTYADWMSELYGINTLNCGFGGTQITSRTPPVATPTTAAEAVAAFDIVNLIGFICNNDYSKLDAALAYIVEHDSEWISTRYTRNLNRLKSVDWSNIKAVTFFAGTNDFSENVPIGNDNDNVTTTIKGAMNIITSTLLQTYPHLKVYWFTPIVRYTASERTDANWCDNSNLPNYVQAIKDQSAKLKLPACDLYHTLGWNQYNFSQYFISTDNVHPYTGFKEIAIKISKFINAN